MTMIFVQGKRKFHVIFAHKSESSFRSSRERKYVGTKVPVTLNTTRMRWLAMDALRHNALLRHP